MARRTACRDRILNLDVLPHFLVIGAMKAGTTSLAAALDSHPDVFIPAEKEPNVLARSSAPDEAIGRYAEVFRLAGAQRVLGEASPSSTKRHLHPHAADLARRALGEDCRLVFVFRDPIERILSHANHLRRRGEDPLSAEIDSESPLVLTSLYAWQLEPWIDAFGRDSLLLVDFERLVGDPDGALDAVQAHLGVARRHLELPHQNAGVSARLEGPFQWLVGSSDFYRVRVRERLPASVRTSARKVFASRSSVEPYRPGDLRLTDGAREALRSDAAAFAGLLDR